MVKKLFFVAVILALQGFTVAFAQGYVLKLNDVTGLPGESITVNIEVINKTPIVAFQLDLPLPKGFSYVPNSTSLVSERKEGHLIQANVLPDSNILRILAFSLSNSNFKGSGGVIGSFQLKVPIMAKGAYTLAIENAIVSDVSAKNLLTGTVNGKIKIAEK